MNRFLICAGLAGLMLPGSQGRADCAVNVRSSVEVAAAPFSLADLLSPASCREVLQSAARIPLGYAPLPGSVRVLTGEEVRSWIDRAASLAHIRVQVRVPERVSVRRLGTQLSCREITLKTASADSIEAAACSSAGRIPADAPLALASSWWNPVLANWEAIARCARPRDCVPFRVQLTGPVLSSMRKPALRTRAAMVVRPGQNVMLISNENGIQISARAVCLDWGGLGDLVRARIAPGARVVEARVESAGVLHAGS